MTLNWGLMMNGEVIRAYLFCCIYEAIKMCPDTVKVQSNRDPSFKCSALKDNGVRSGQFNRQGLSEIVPAQRRVWKADGGGCRGPEPSPAAPVARG